MHCKLARPPPPAPVHRTHVHRVSCFDMANPGRFSSPFCFPGQIFFETSLKKLFPGQKEKFPGPEKSFGPDFGKKKAPAAIRIVFFAKNIQKAKVQWFRLGFQLVFFDFFGPCGASKISKFGCIMLTFCGTAKIFFRLIFTTATRGYHHIFFPPHPHAGLKPDPRPGRRTLHQ